MKLALRSLDASGLSLALPMGGKDEPSPRIAVRTAKGLGGELETKDAGFSLRGLSADSVELDRLHLDFETVVLAVESRGEPGAPGVLRRVTGGVAHEGHVVIDAEAGEVHATPLRVDVTTVGVRVEGEVHVESMRLSVDDGRGEVSGLRVQMRDFSFTWGEIEVRAPRAEARGMLIGWGELFVLEIDVLDVPELDLLLRSPEMRIRARKVRLERARIHGGEIELGSASAEAISLSLELGEKSADEPATAPDGEAKAKKGVDLSLLDGVDGELNVDLFVDLSLPILGSRRATHRFRVPIEAGSVDYIRLENDLSTLESSLLDFALRSDGTLVLELGIPFLPTRGRGKPIVVWQLTPEDRALAERRRVRLALLPEARLAGDDGERREAPPRDKEDSSFALRKLGFRSIDTTLSLVAPSHVLTGPVEKLAVHRLRITGDVEYDASATPPGEIRGEAQRVSLALRPIALGAGELSLPSLEIEKAPSFIAKFSGVSPRTITAQLEGIALADFAYRG